MFILLTSTKDWVYPHFLSDLSLHHDFVEIHTIGQLLEIQNKKHDMILYLDTVLDDQKEPYNERLLQLVKSGKVYLPVVVLACNALDRKHIWNQSFYFLLWVTEKNSIPQFKEYGNIDNCIYLGFGASPILFFKESWVKKDIGVSFISRDYNKEGVKQQYVKHWFPDNIYLDGGISFDMLNHIFNRSKINLNTSDDPTTRTMVLKERVFEITMSGNFLLTQYCQELEDNFEIGREIETWQTKKELHDKIKYYLSHNKEREIIAKRGYEKCIANYTNSQRVDILLEFAHKRRAKMKHPKDINPKESPNPKQVWNGGKWIGK